MIGLVTHVDNARVNGILYGTSSVAPSLRSCNAVIMSIEPVNNASSIAPDVKPALKHISKSYLLSECYYILVGTRLT